jgi:hypothetical protein
MALAIAIVRTRVLTIACLVARIVRGNGIAMETSKLEIIRPTLVC